MIRKVILIILMFLMLSFSYSYITFKSFDYKAEYLEPGKTYDVYVVIETDKEINNTILYLKPFNNITKENIEFIKDRAWIGKLFPGDVGVGHFIIKIKPSAFSYDYKVVVYCEYNYKDKVYKENRVFTLPVRGKSYLTIEPLTNTLKVGNNKITLLVTNSGTGTANDIKIDFYGDNLDILGQSSFYISSLTPGFSKCIYLDVYAKTNGVGILKYKISYTNPYNLLELTQKSETISYDSKSETLTYKNLKSETEEGTINFYIYPQSAIIVNLENSSLTVGKLENISFLIKNNYKDALFILKLNNSIGNNEKYIYIKKGTTKKVNFLVKFDKVGIYPLNLEIYADKLDIKKTFLVNVVGKADLVFSQLDVENNGYIKITGDIDNIGSGVAKSVLLSIEENKDIKPLRPYESYFVGTLNPDDYASFELHCQIDENVSEIPIKITYRDENNNLITIYRTIKIQNLNTTNQNNKENNNYLLIGFGILFLLGVLFLIYKGFRRML
ncbi:hypothetical protein ACPB8Q_07210 [Methanocaldococcus indicus]|uniref:COG1361 S-layer family protein n=1 Tax=Methanocaldococcus indicus TaxID=213231 RepID=UPI003C6CEFFB